MESMSFSLSGALGGDAHGVRGHRRLVGASIHGMEAQPSGEMTE